MKDLFPEKKRILHLVEVKSCWVERMEKLETEKEGIQLMEKEKDLAKIQRCSGHIISNCKGQYQSWKSSDSV
jgi:hypothetical protein